MEENKRLKVTDLRIGDKVRDKRTGFEMIVTGMLWGIDEPLTDVTIYTYSDRTRDRYIVEDCTELELVERR